MINYRIVVDSCGEFTEDMKKNPHFAHAALHLSIDGEQFVDDETFDRLDFLAKMKESPNCPKSSCPSRKCTERHLTVGLSISMQSHCPQN